jgi:peptide/nickel transport system permease protein
VTQYIIRRLLLIIPTLLGVSLLVTGMMRLLPGDAVDLLVNENAIGGGSEAFNRLVTDEIRNPSWPGVEPDDPDREGFQRARRGEAELDVLAKSNMARDRAREAGVNLDVTEERREFIDSLPGAQRLQLRNAMGLDAYKDSIRRELGLDKGFFGQWWEWVSNAARGDLGQSILGSRKVNDELIKRLPVTFELGLLAMFFGAIIAIPTGIISAVKQDSAIDYFARSTAVAMLALPSFFAAVIVIALLSGWFNYSFPLFYKQIWESPTANLEQMVIPAFILGATALSGVLMRLTRAQMLEVMRQDYIRTARSKGLAGQTVVMGHAVRNALLPVITVLGIQIPVLIGGSVVIEEIFAIPGVARYLYRAILERDFPPIIAINMVIALIVVLANLVIDVAYAYLDPRVKLA